MVGWGESNPRFNSLIYGVFIANCKIRGPTRGPKNKTVYMNFNQLVLRIAQQLTGPQFVPIKAVFVMRPSFCRAAMIARSWRSKV